MKNSAFENQSILQEANWEQIDESSCAEDYAAYLEWLEASGLMEKHRSILFEMLPLNSSDHILDAGCGLGAHCRVLAKRIGKEGSVTGIDKSEVMIRSAREMELSEKGAPVQFDIGDVCELPYPANSFGGIISDRVFMHLERPMEALREFKRVLKPNGWVAIGEPDWSSFKIQPDSPQSRLLIEAQKSGFKNPAFGREISERLILAGFQVLQSHCLTYDVGRYGLSWKMLNLDRAERRVLVEKKLSRKEIHELKMNLKKAEKKNRLFFTNSMHICLGQKKGSL